MIGRPAQGHRHQGSTLVHGWRFSQKGFGCAPRELFRLFLAGGDDRLPLRVAQGGEMLAPGTPEGLISYIDVRDLAEFMRTCVENRVAGTYNLVNKPGTLSIGGLIETSKRVTGANPTVTWAPVEFLKAQGLIAGELVSSPALPIWDPPDGDIGNIGLVRCDRAIAQGLKLRSMEQTVRDTLEWQKSRPAADQVLKAGLRPEREAELLKLLHG